MLGDVLIMSAVFPAGVLEAVGRPCGVLVVAALGSAWFLYGVARLATFAAFSTPRPEAPWSTTDADGAVVVGQGDVTVPAQDTRWWPCFWRCTFAGPGMRVLPSYKPGGWQAREPG